MCDDLPLNQPGFNPFAELIGFKVLRCAEGQSEIALDIRKDHFHPGGVVHGGVAFTLADSSMAIALMSDLEMAGQVSTIELKISYIAAVREGKLVAEGSIVRRGKRVAFMESKVYEGDRLVATATASFAILDS